MIRASTEKTDDTWVIFVTKDEALGEKVAQVCTNVSLVPEPDMLVAILNRLAK